MRVIGPTIMKSFVDAAVYKLDKHISTDGFILKFGFWKSVVVDFKPALFGWNKLNLIDSFHEHFQRHLLSIEYNQFSKTLLVRFDCVWSANYSVSLVFTQTHIHIRTSWNFWWTISIWRWSYFEYCFTTHIIVMIRA